MRILFLFLDGIGLGEDDPARNPFAQVRMPHLENLLGGKRLLAKSAPFIGERASLIPLDAILGVNGPPQSATGQAVLLTGVNVPAAMGMHYGPKPNRAVADHLSKGSIFSWLRSSGKSVALLNAYPPRYFYGIKSGRHLYSAIPLAVTSAGIRLFNKDDLFAGCALSADFTGKGWMNLLGFPAAPILTAHAAGLRLLSLSRQYDFSLFEYWSTDYAGHKQDMKWAGEQLRTIDEVIGGLVEFPTDEVLILITSDHGNMEDLSTRRHTNANVPAILIGPAEVRNVFASKLIDLTGIASAILSLLLSPSETTPK